MTIKRDPTKLKTLDDWLDEEGIRGEVTATAKAIVGRGLEQKRGRIKPSGGGIVEPIVDHATNAAGKPRNRDGGVGK